MTPILNFAFANNDRQPLTNLRHESDSIIQLLASFEHEGRIILHREQQATIDNVSDFLTRNNNPMTLFHYGGHADSESLILDGQTAFATGVARQLAQQKSLKLVFLNGCSTYAQVQFLLQWGIPAVIATSVPVNDSIATKFAISFYTAIANNQTIKEAFDRAAAVVETKRNFLPKFYRGLGQAPISSTSWGLYTSQDDVLEEKLIPSAPTNLSEKNVFDKIDVEIKKGNFRGGDDNLKQDKEQKYHRKNIMTDSKVRIEEGDFRLGDNYS